MILFALGPILIGFALSFVFGFSIPFVKNRAIYYGACGIYLTTATIWYGSIHQYKIYDRFLACFQLREEEKQAVLLDTLLRNSDTLRQLRSVFTVFVVAATVAFVGFWHNEIDRALGLGPIAGLFCFQDFKKAQWYRPEYRSIAFAITMLFAMWASIPLGTAYRLMLRMPGILIRCSKKGSTLFPRLIKLHFGPLTSFYTRICFFWSLGVILLVLLFRGNNNWFFLVAIGFLTILGIVNFGVPQFIYGRVAGEAGDYWLERAGQELGQLSTRKELEQKGPGNTLPPGGILNVDNYFFTHDRWVYPINETYFVAAAQLASLVIGLLALK